MSRREFKKMSCQKTYLKCKSSEQHIRLEAPSNLAQDYVLEVPSYPPGEEQLLCVDANGKMSYQAATQTDGSELETSGQVLNITTLTDVDNTLSLNDRTARLEVYVVGGGGGGGSVKVSSTWHTGNSAFTSGDLYKSSFVAPSGGGGVTTHFVTEVSDDFKGGVVEASIGDGGIMGHHSTNSRSDGHGEDGGTTTLTVKSAANATIVSSTANGGTGGGLECRFQFGDDILVPGAMGGRDGTVSGTLSNGNNAISYSEIMCGKSGYTNMLKISDSGQIYYRRSKGGEPTSIFGSDVANVEEAIIKIDSSDVPITTNGLSVKQYSGIGGGGGGYLFFNLSYSSSYFPYVYGYNGAKGFAVVIEYS